MSFVLTDGEYEQFRQMLRERARQREPGIVFRPGIGKTGNLPVRYPRVPEARGGGLPAGNRVGQGYFMVTDERGAMTLPFFTNPG